MDTFYLVIKVHTSIVPSLLFMEYQDRTIFVSTCITSCIQNEINMLFKYVKEEKLNRY